MELTADTTATDILENVRATLAGATVGQVLLFKEVRVIDDLESFRQAGSALEGTVAGILGSPPAEGDPTDNSALRSYRMAIAIGVRFMVKRAMGADERAAVNEMNRLTGLIRQALREDKTRGGKAHRIEWGSRILDGTDLDGEPRLDARVPNQAFYTCVIPAAVGWETPA